MGERRTESANPNNSIVDLTLTGRRENTVTISSDEDRGSSGTESSDEDSHATETVVKPEGSSSSKKRKRVDSKSFFSKILKMREEEQKDLVKSTANFIDQKSRTALFKLRLEAMHTYALAKNFDLDQLNEATQKLQDQMFPRNNDDV